MCDFCVWESCEMCILKLFNWWVKSGSVTLVLFILRGRLHDTVFNWKVRVFENDVMRMRIMSSVCSP